MKFSKCVFVLFVFAISFFGVLSCNSNLKSKESFDNLNTEEYIPSINTEITIDNFKTNFGKAIFLTVQASRDVIETLEYSDLMDNNISIRSKVYKSKDLISFSDLGDRYRDKIKLSRNNKNQDNFFESENNFLFSTKQNNKDLSTETSVNEFENLLLDYRSDIDNLIPAYEDGNLDGYLTISEGKIYVCGDVISNVGSLESIALIELYNRVKNGEDLVDVINDIQNDVNQILVDENCNYDTKAKAVFVNPSLGSGIAIDKGIYATYERWTDGKVYYQWDGISDSQKEVVKKSMDIWQNGTDNAVKFIQIEPNAWDWFCYALGQKNWVQMQVDNSIVGQALIGAGWGSYLKLNSTIDDINNSYCIGVASHELGHVLGLMHEFQRPDRDKYCIVDSEFINGAKGISKIANYDKLPAKAIVVGLKKVKVWCVTLYIPYISYHEYASVYNGFDFDSVMQYYFLKLKNTKEAFEIIKRDINLSNPRIHVSFVPKNDCLDFYNDDFLLKRLCILSGFDEVSKDSVLKNYDIQLKLINRNTKPSCGDLGAIKKLYNY